MDFDSTSVLKVSLSILAFLCAIIGHEIMHGYVAKHYGDPTASMAGRLSINPIKHIDLMGSIIVPLMLLFAQAPFMFGWAKPVPIDIRSIIARHGFMPAVYVSLAGIFYNLSIALVVSTALKYGFSLDGKNILEEIFVFFCLQLVVYNVILGVFNLFPIPPLDGSQALMFLCLHFGYETLPRWFMKIQGYGFIIILVILATPLSKILFQPVEFLIKFLLS
ncbi:site-2 protease family protein [Helicobacter mustelae]|uniref:Putative membrane-associated metallopeptidase n=1 Tax=Helicobacter mustelae (strain ATCC 43772 / CCUG 25715 / CIP 103759 / LMG 18044 / NCTC 12198 / R85-136P) TaxID=679897 RepID=D3UHD3_HELM1|nr:site-2 protease family protein [Helicobacter mustelae]CBG39905.1 putative membrane-associated metallopeptidase [Helicobacter mustelae 12198]SQH71416.1 membrane-associated metallopeptidase [Helicobacter mustelae]STP12544.1 membrane-associated metallopeptidase [Helicobacter mustelae]